MEYRVAEKQETQKDLSVGLGNTLELVLLLDGVGVRGTLGGVDQLVGKALSNGLDVAERSLASTLGQQRDSLATTKTDDRRTRSMLGSR